MWRCKSSSTLPLIIFILLALTATMAQSIVPRRITQVIDEQKLVRLAGAVHPFARAQFDRGAAPDSMPLDRIHLVLKRSPAQDTALQQFLNDVHRPGSPVYHKWLTPEQFGEQFGPSDEDIATVASWLASYGFRVNKVLPGKQVLEFSGNVAQMHRAFHTDIRKYVVNGETHHASATDPQVPEALVAVIGGFVSLNNFRAKYQPHLLGKATYDLETRTAMPEWTRAGANGGVNFPVAPGDFAVQYDLGPLYAAGTKGDNQTIAVVLDSNINVAVVNQFRSLFGLSANPPQVIIDGNDPGIDGINNPEGPTFGSTEAYLDVEQSGAVAPNAAIDLVISADTALQAGFVLAAEHAVFSNLAPIISLSLGFCEAGLGTGNTFFNNLWAQAAAQGISVTVAAGDNGAAGCDDFNTQEYAISGLGVSGFASTPYNIAVGGTDFFYTGQSQIPTYWNTTATQLPQTSLLKVVPEQPWNDSQYGRTLLDFFGLTGMTTIAAGSGGRSACATGTPTVPLQVGGSCAGYPKPAWQTGTPADGVRDLPDLSLFAADGANFSFIPICASDTDCQVPSGSNRVQITGVGGTSAAAPAFAGILALVNQKYGRQGQANFVLYPLKTQFPAAFHDIPVGTNSVPCAFSPSSPNCISVANPITVTDPVLGTATEGQIGTSSTPDFNAAAGYNLATGLGSIDANVLVTNWNNIHFTSTTVNLTSPTAGTNVTHGTAINFIGSVGETGGSTPTGNIAIMTDSTEPLNQGEAIVPLNSGSFNGSINFLPGGTYHVWANYGGDATNAPSASAKVQISVSPEASTIVFNLLNATGNVALPSGGVVPYGTQLILDAEPVPTTFYNQCIVPPNPPASCNTASFTAATGSVTFADNSTNINVANVNGEGDAEYNPAWSVGAHSVSAHYSGDASYSASTSSAINFTTIKETPTITLSSNQQSPPIVFNLLVENNANGANGFSVPAAVSPTGSINVSGFPAGVPTSAALSATRDPATFSPVGLATITVPAGTPAGTYSVTVSYPGDSNYNSTSQNFPSVTIVGSGTFTAAASTTTATAGGTAASSAITLTASGGFTGTVAVTCPAATLPPGVTCAPLNITVPPGTGNLMVSVAAPSAAGMTVELRPGHTIHYAAVQGPGRNAWWKFSLGTGLVAIFLLFLPGPRKHSATLGLLLICFFGFVIGCGGGGSSGGVTGPSPTVTKMTVPGTKAAQGVALTFNVAITASGSPAGSGMVQLLDAGAVIASAAAVNGTANFTNITSLSVGTHSISARYLGDVNTAASQSGTANVNVTGTATIGIATNPASSNNASFNLTIN